MLGGNNGNPILPMFIDENRMAYHQTNVSNQLQLFGNVPNGCGGDPVNYFGNEHAVPNLRPNNKRGREIEDVSRHHHQKLQISLNYTEADRSVSVPNPNPNPNAVSTGLRLSYDDDERNSTVTSASGSITAAAAAPPSFVYSLGDNVRTELDRQKEEFDQYMKIQEEQLAKGVREMKQRHVSAFVAAIERGVGKKLREKEAEIESVNEKNKELVERIKQVASEAQSWHYRAKYNESVVNVLKTNLQQAISQDHHNRGGAKEGFGDSEVDDAASSFADPAGRHLSRQLAVCRACGSREVSMLLMPCRHLCLCKECDGFVGVCPVCRSMKTASFQVQLS